jgi:outer membrane receptor protein involved in Fe transport
MRKLEFALFSELLFAIAQLEAQGTGVIHGAVTDPSGLGVSSASVTATLVERGLTRNVLTNAQGDFLVPSLPVGSYRLTVEVRGFKQFRREGITLTANQNVQVAVVLDLGSLTEQVTVTADAPLVDSRSSVVGALVDGRRITELPINGRNVISLAAILPGATEISAPQSFTGDRSGPTISISGSRTNQNLFLLDGAHYNALFRNTGLNYPPPDALQEVKVLTNTYNAEYGRNSGSVFNVVTRSGTNQIHGSLWEFHRNDNLNARNFFAPSRIPQLIQNQFGAALGGPILKNRLFVFGAYEGLRVRPESLATAAFPLTERERRGDFSASRASIRDPQTGQPFPGNQIPVSRFDTVAGNVLSQNLMPLPNRPDGQLVQTFRAPEDNNQVLYRMDLNLGKHTFDGRYNFNLATDRSAVGQVPTYTPTQGRATMSNITLGDTLVITPSLLNQIRLSFNRFTVTSFTSNTTHISQLGSNFPLLGPPLPPNLNITGRVNLGSGSPSNPWTVNESYQASESLHWTRGAHSVKAGVEYLKGRYFNLTVVRTMGVFTFNGQISGVPAADFALGRPSSIDVASPVRDQGGLQHSVYSFIQDDWKIHPRLTLNLGLRYELPLPWFHPIDTWGTLHVGKQSQVIPNAPVGLVYPGDPGVPRGLIQTDRNNFAPRIGFAYDPFGKGRTSIRSAYGIFYETMNADVIQNDGQPFNYTFTIPQPFSLSDPLRGQAPIPLTVNTVNPRFSGLQQISYPDPNMRTGYVQHFNFMLQHEIVRDLSVQAGYVGKLGRKLMMVVGGNPAVFRPGATLGNTNQRRILQGFGENRIISSQANSYYHGMQMQVEKRHSKGFTLQGAYTWSRAMDMASGITTSIAQSPPNVFDLSTQIGLSDFHAKHIASASWIWDLPKLSGQHAAVRNLMGGWSLNGLLTYRSGNPINVLTGADNAFSATPLQRPNAIGEHRLPDGRAKGDRVLAWFNRAAFAVPTAGTFGNVGRNALIGPSTKRVNAALFKSFPIAVREGMRGQFRAEFFNLFNHVNFGNPEARLNAGERMGRITSAGEARVIQFAIKVLF